MSACIIKRLPLTCVLPAAIILLACSAAIAQNSDSLKGKSDTAAPHLTNVNAVTDKAAVTGDSIPSVKNKPHSAKKALLYSALLPGLGQAYNRKYWKIPIIYAGLGAMGYFIYTNNLQYVAMQNALVIRTNGGIDQYQQYTTVQLTTLRDQWHYNRDLSVVGALAVYVLQLVDAEVDAQFFNFNMSDDISAHFAPAFSPVSTLNGFNMVPSLALVIKLK